MKRTLSQLLTLSLLFFFFSACSQDSISSKEASKYIGETKTVCGKVVSTFYAQSSKGKPTFLNLDKAYPNQIFTIVIWKDDRSKFEHSPEDFYKGKNICVTGTITEYNGEPQIEVTEPEQITIKKEE